ncbi:ATP-binding protein, partial [Chryseobacterium sp. SN22]
MKNSLILIILFTIISCNKDSIVIKQPPTNKHFERAASFRDQNNSDSAFYYFNLSKNDFLDKKDSLGVARALINMALLQYSKGDFYGSIET